MQRRLAVAVSGRHRDSKDAADTPRNLRSTYDGEDAAGTPRPRHHPFPLQFQHALEEFIHLLGEECVSCCVQVDSVRQDEFISAGPYEVIEVQEGPSVFRREIAHNLALRLDFLIHFAAGHMRIIDMMLIDDGWEGHHNDLASLGEFSPEFLEQRAEFVIGDSASAPFRVRVVIVSAELQQNHIRIMGQDIIVIARHCLSGGIAPDAGIEEGEAFTQFLSQKKQPVLFGRDSCTPGGDGISKSNNVHFQ